MNIHHAMGWDKLTSEYVCSVERPSALRIHIRLIIYASIRTNIDDSVITVSYVNVFHFSAVALSFRLIDSRFRLDYYQGSFYILFAIDTLHVMQFSNSILPTRTHTHTHTRINPYWTISMFKPNWLHSDFVWFDSVHLSCLVKSPNICQCVLPIDRSCQMGQIYASMFHTTMSHCHMHKIWTTLTKLRFDATHIHIPRLLSSRKWFKLI